ncbi:MAG: hypothetical protein A2161_15270 [Candidatus Schekmanbacteria bacterium RBG_13_48_7]|uniref:Uncharacterized protein n=1 Tax=Candidatus Schekmanbacteria bacterium RBG_13_48_7 TaxID=1817878 RepID=A0A1F7RMI7_9BACT|nr:MAG: hypothetical protein A2161_15270 [Candidatus Schekmanbacteria bacterium RBG_13_48_7]
MFLLEAGNSRWNRFPARGKTFCSPIYPTGLFPTAISRPDGTIIVNKNFTRLMYLLKRKGLDMWDGLMHGLGDDDPVDTPLDSNWASIYAARARGASGHDHWVPDLGYVYHSILYAIAIHEIRGYFRIERERVVFDSDELHAHGERGDRTLYVNLAALLWFFYEEDILQKYSDWLHFSDFFDKVIKNEIPIN